MATTPFPVQPGLIAITVGYRNTSLIADEVLPRVLTPEEFRYLEYNLGDAYTIPKTLVGRTGKPTQLELSATEKTDKVEDYALDEVIPQRDIDRAQVGHNPVSRSVEVLTDLILLDREVRAANLVFNADKYASSNKKTLSGNAQWSDFTNSDPVNEILTALDVPVMRPNVMVVGQQVWTKLCQHPKVVKAIYGHQTDTSVVSKKAVAELFGLEDLLVGQAQVNTAKEGKTAALARVWGKSCALIYRNKLADNQRGITFGITAQSGQRDAGQMPEPHAGRKGGTRVRVGESVKEVLIAANVGYLLSAAVA